MATYGYIRVSSCSQSLNSQYDELINYGIEPNNIYSDVVSGVKENKENFNNLMNIINEGDTLVISRWDRISRSLQQLLFIIEDLTKRNINLISIHEKVDLSTAEGKLFVSLFGMLAEYQRNIIKQRQAEGIASAKARGKVIGGRKPVPKQKLDLAIELYLANNMPVSEIVETVGISRSSLYNEIRKRNVSR